MRTRSIICTLLLALVAPVAAFAHGAHGHHIMGTITAVHPNHIMVKTADDKTVGITLNDKTEFFKKEAKANVAATAKDLREDLRVVVDVTGEADNLTGTRVVMSTASSGAHEHHENHEGKGSGELDKK